MGGGEQEQRSKDNLFGKASIMVRDGVPMASLDPWLIPTC